MLYLSVSLEIIVLLDVEVLFAAHFSIKEKPKKSKRIIKTSWTVNEDQLNQMQC